MKASPPGFHSWYMKYSSNWSSTRSTGPPTRSAQPPMISASAPRGGVEPQRGRKLRRCRLEASLDAGDGVAAPARNDGRQDLRPPVSSRFRAAVLRNSYTTPARRTELLPTPLGPYMTVTRYASRWSVMIPHHAVAPEEVLGVLLGVGQEALIGRPPRRPRARRSFPNSGSAVTRTRLHSLHPLVERDVDDVDAMAVPELLVDWVRLLLDRPRRERARLLRPDVVENDAEVPVAHPVAEEEEVARAHLRHQRGWDQVVDIRPRDVVDVVVLGDDVAVFRS